MEGRKRYLKNKTIRSLDLNEKLSSRKVKTLLTNYLRASLTSSKLKKKNVARLTT